MNLSISIRELWNLLLAIVSKCLLFYTYTGWRRHIVLNLPVTPFSSVSSSNILIRYLPIFVCLQLIPASVTIYAKK